MVLSMPRLTCAIIAAAILATGCQRRHALNPQELRKLHTFKRGNAIPIQTVEGQTLMFHHRTRVALVTSDGQGPAQAYDSILIEGEVFVGKTRDGKIVRADLRDIHGAVIVTREFLSRPTWITLTVVGSVAGAIVVFAGIVLLFAYLIGALG